MFFTAFEKIAESIQKSYESTKNFEFNLKISSHQYNVRI